MRDVQEEIKLEGGGLDKVKRFMRIEKDQKEDKGRWQRWSRRRMEVWKGDLLRGWRCRRVISQEDGGKVGSSLYRHPPSRPFSTLLSPPTYSSTSTLLLDIHPSSTPTTSFQTSSLSLTNLFFLDLLLFPRANHHSLTPSSFKNFSLILSLYH